jgi:hypothetical protein
MSWEGVQDAVEDDGRLSSDLIIDVFATKRDPEHRVKVLESEMQDLKERLMAVTDERDELEGDVEYLEGLVRSYDYEIYDEWHLFDSDTGEVEYNSFDSYEYLVSVAEEEGT